MIKTNEASTNKLVLWTGGLDSTLTLINILQNSTPGSVRTIAFDIDQISNRQQKMEKKARKKLKKRMLKIYDICDWDHQELTIDLHNQLHGQGCQPSLWISLASMMSKMDEDVYISWLKDDYDSELIHSAKQIWKHLAIINGKKVDGLKLPLIFNTKADVINDMRESTLSHLCWYCEGTEGKKGRPCGKCNCCINNKASTYKAKLLRKHNKDN